MENILKQLSHAYNLALLSTIATEHTEPRFTRGDHLASLELTMGLAALAFSALNIDYVDGLFHERAQLFNRAF